MSNHSPSFGRTSADTRTQMPTTSSETDSRRRYALQYLAQFEYPVELRTLAAYVAAALAMVPVETVSADERKRVTIRLHHVDIPQLVADGIVTYDPESRMAVCTGALDGMDRYTDASDRSHRSA